MHPAIMHNSGSLFSSSADAIGCSSSDLQHDLLALHGEVHIGACGHCATPPEAKELQLGCVQMREHDQGALV